MTSSPVRNGPAGGDAARPGDTAAGEPLLRVANLAMHFPGTRSRHAGVRAVDDVSFTVAAGECLAIVGESGSGKSTLARALLRLVQPTSGAVYYRGRDLLRLRAGELRAQRRNIQMIFQDPYASLHPRQTVAQIISEPWKVHAGLVRPEHRTARLRELLAQVGLPTAYASLHPSRLSGGERQRVAIARALALRPELLVLDEPVSALDVSIQAQVINVLMSLQRELGLAYVFISHDLSLVRLVADRVAVMYRGRFVEVAPAEQLYARPVHPYTQALLRSSPSLNSGDALALTGFVDGDTSAGLNTAAGCRFRNRCPKAQDRCATDVPELAFRAPATDPAHHSACHFADLPDPDVRPLVPARADHQDR